jgi:hypothetical protein
MKHVNPSFEWTIVHLKYRTALSRSSPVCEYESLFLLITRLTSSKCLTSCDLPIQEAGYWSRDVGRGATNPTFLLKVYHAFKKTMVKVNRCRAFTAIGFTRDIERMPSGLPVDNKSSDKVTA